MNQKPPLILTTDEVKRRYDALLISYGLPPMYFPRP
jgi:hypothetical protein